MRSIAVTIAFALACARAWGQDVRATVLDAARPVRDLPAAAAAKRNTVAERQRYQQAISRIREHHRPVPLQEAAKPFSDTLEQAAAKVVKKGEPISFPKNIKILAQKSVVVSAGLQLNFASPIGEPTVAATANEVLVTGNWYAALSLDRGATFKALDPYRLFDGASIGNGFCCDQVAFHDPKSDTTFWLLQGGRDARGNMFRILFATGSEQLRKQDWQYLDITAPKLVGAEGFWLDFPSFAASDSHLYLTANVFTTSDSAWSGSVVVKMDKQSLLRGDNPKASTWTSQQYGSMRLIEGARDTMYWASQASNGSLMVWSWPDADSEPSKGLNVEVEKWSTQGPSDHAAHSPNGRPWLKRLDGRITAGWLANDTMGFAWTAREDNRFRLPHVRVAILPVPLPQPAGPFTPVRPMAQPHIWSDEFALAYPAVGVDSAGRTGASVSIGGKSLFPTHAIGVLTRENGDFKWGFAVSTRGVNTPSCIRNDAVDQDCGVWGDYFTVRPHPGRENSWATVGYSIRSKVGEQLWVEPEYYWFHSE